MSGVGQRCHSSSSSSTTTTTHCRLSLYPLAAAAAAPWSIRSSKEPIPEIFEGDN